MKTGKALYLDHQATTPLDSQVFAAMKPYLEQSFGNPHSADHAIGWQAARAVEHAAEQVANLFNCDSDEIIFTSGATEANNLALLGLGRRAVTGTRKRILIGATEHKCVLSVGRVLEEQLGYEVTTLPVDDCGRIDLEILDKLISKDVLVVSVMAVNNEIGTIQDIRKIAELTSRTGSLLHCDGAQAPCAIDLSKISEHVDFFSISGHKMYGPMGIGALYVRRDLQSDIEPLIYGGGQQHDLRSGTLPTALCVGLGEAADLARRNEAVDERTDLARKRDLFVERLKVLPCSVVLNGPFSGAERHPGNANICFKGFSAHELLGVLQPHLAASMGSACNSGIPEPSHVLRAIGLTELDAESSVRFSLGRQTRDEDICEAVDLIAKALADLENAGLRQFA